MVESIDGERPPADPDAVRERVRRYWDWRAASFQADIGAMPNRQSWLDAYSGAVARLLPGRSAPLRVLDVGSGTGFVAIAFAELGHDVTAVEPAAAMTAIAEREAAAAGVRIDVRTGYADPLPPLPPGFDLVTCRNLLWTLPDPVRALAAWRSVLRPGGAVLVADGMWNTPRQELRLLCTGWRSRAARPVGWRFLAAYRGLRRDLPYYRGLDESAARGLMLRAGYTDPTVLTDLLATDAYEAGTGDGHFLAAAHAA
ncbi:class I SAM-dependent methyltransferase [Marinitenerispora sediminis]|uniref:SAM-dependent methyltransferase n=1 Tax=Marinitenerispora sediminis TaxID=1931232 RepID=A0A368T2D3_9ACTN|nr:class I SAM-dependent methyltransferase [Marinitenerispora sediminis]RCV47775.1 SAM-dependent methyltransferase [Marinitenerispora sediminis]RCV48373.1 SAM-dependent methyltransferase [Marinitenerispora sediminis]RCV50109.1 SAM-dependent methyltransferase [Marinitenerispora sediminis]